MKKMIMVVMMVMAIATGCQSNVKEVGKIHSVAEELMTIRHMYRTQYRVGDQVKVVEVSYIYKDGKRQVVDKSIKTYSLEDYLVKYCGADA